MELGLNVPNLKGDFGKIHDEIKREGIQNLIETKPYHAGSWGPPKAELLIEKDGRSWHV